MMLALDTSSNYLSIALQTGDDILDYHQLAGQKHAEQTLPAIGRLLAEAGMSLTSLDAIVFGQGPGSFTGLRIGCGLAQGLAFSADLPLIAIPTLDAIAVQAPEGEMLVCVDARMQQVYWAHYRRQDKQLERLSDIHLSDPHEISLPPGVDCAVGDALANYPQLLPQRAGIQILADVPPHARAYLGLAQSGRYPRRHPREAELLYIRNKVALTSAEQQARKA
ncbi:tRNA (adenosine(37)-N6)-threonylcarbamoyltransferase complex dimerization subunit type 1 TsaB [uncultured Aquitalea sp.]|uniref:tRNA (adenosine(37)-N6)-threonylcarbamoyltransferase complex dimerization subunit type 1 TsaB n=1 Tax=uncultured Aquitalea sp. TaxID=540272 RepID=UPI0025F2BFEB|nr:tRNA (adenosine(37)-N6)-threonylcarbamoyltransferase complex dimerization subunit type 1 TsaB [uncultured Aquitalea sp.]